eukprot:sb/3469579/
MGGYNKLAKKPEDEPSVPGNQHNKSAAMLILALSIHSFFEGLAIGVESTQNVFIQLAAAITVHKCVIAFAVGSRLIHCGKKKLEMVLCLGCMCIMTPIGVILAIGILELLDEYTLLIVSGSIQGVSTGFFLYITFAEMLFQEMKSKHDSALKVSFMTFGVLLVTISTIWHNWNGDHAHYESGQNQNWTSLLEVDVQNARRDNLYYLQQTYPILILSTLTLNTGGPD